MTGESDSAPDRSTSRAGTHAAGGDAGFAGGAEVLPFGLLIFVVGTLLVANVWAVIDARFAVDAAAREAARHYVESDVVDRSGQPHAEAAAVEAGLAALGAHGRDQSRADLRLTDVTGGDGREFVRCARVTFTASYDVPALTLPWIGGFGSGFRVSGRHNELIDPYRDGVPGEASGC